MAKTPSQKQIAAFIVGHGITDFVSGGKLSLIERNAIWKVLKKLGPVTGRAAVGAGRMVGASALGAVAPLAPLAGPVGGAALGYGILQTPQGQALLEAAEERGRMDRIRFEQGLTDLRIAGGEFGRDLAEINFPSQKVARKKTKSAYNTAVSKAMKALKKSTSYGKKGVLNSPKKAFGFVARTVSKLRRGKKVPSKGASGVVKRSIPGISKIKVRKP
jgi:hypothetical protein